MAGEQLIRTPESAPPTLRDIAVVLFRRRRVWLGVCSTIFAAAVLYAIAGAKYEARMKILVGRGRANAPISAQENAPIDLTRMAITQEELNTEVELLRDDEVLRQVVQEIGVSRNWFPFFQIGQGNAERIEQAARRLSGKIKVAPIKKTNLIAVTYAAQDPQMASRVLQVLEKAYLEKHTQVHRPSGEHRFFESQIAASRRQLEEAKQRLTDFMAEHDVVAAAEQRDLSLQKLSELDAGYRQTVIARVETQERVWQLESQLQKLPERTVTQVRTADNPELLKALKSTLLDLQLKRTTLLTKFEPSHRLVQEVQQQITETEAAIGAESASPIRDETTDKNPQFEWTRSELEKAQVELKALEARQAATRMQVATFRAMARQLGVDAITQNDLLRSEQAAEDNYLLYVKKREEARMDDALDERGIVNVAIAEHPMTPALPLWSAWAVLGLGLCAAGIGGTCAAFVADYMDPRLRTPEDVRMYLNTPVLASLPGLEERLLP